MNKVKNATKEKMKIYIQSDYFIKISDKYLKCLIL